MVSGVGLPIVDYQLATQTQNQLLAQFQKSPSYSQAVAYYQANIGSVKTPDDLINNPKLLNVALSAFQLESEAPNTAIIRALLTQDPTKSTSLAQQLIDPRFSSFAKAFSSLSTDGGATISNPSSINAVLAGYQTNEFQKFVSKTDNDPTVRQAMYFSQTVNDTIDISKTANLYKQFQQSPGIQQTISSYKSGIAGVTSVNALLDNPPVLTVALSAFNIDPRSVSTDTLRQILTEPASAAATDPLLTSDPRLAQFAQAFSSLNSDGGVTVQSSSSINTILTDYQTNQFAKTLASGNQATTSAAFGASGSDTISTLLTDFMGNSGVAQSISYYQNNIASVTSVSDLVNNPQLLNVALGAFNLNSTSVPAAVVTQLLTNDPNAPSSVQTQATALLQNDPDVAKFVQAFSSLNSNSSSSDFSKISNLFQQFQQLPSVQQAVNGFQNQIGAVNTVAELVANPQVLNVALGAFNIDPSTVSTSTISQILTESPASQATDPLLTSDPRFAQFVQVFGSLNSDGGAELHTQAGINSVVNAYQSNLFAQTLATNDPATITADFGTDGSTAVSSLLYNFQGTSGVSQAVSYYQNNIDTVGTVNDLIGNPQLLNVALGAFNIDPKSVSTFSLSFLLTESPAQQASDPLVTSNPNMAKFVQAFGSLNIDNGLQIRNTQNINAVTSAFQANQFQQSIALRTQEVTANPGLASSTPLSVSNPSSVAAITSAFQANQFQQSIASKVQEVTASPALGSISTIELLGNPTLSAVTLGALGLPAQTGALDPTEQEQLIANTGFDPNRLTDPTYLKQFVNQFLANAGQQAGITGTGAADVALAALQAGSGASGPTPIDLSFLAIGSGSSTSNSSSGTGSLVSLFA